MKYSTFIRHGSIGRAKVPNRGVMLKRGSGASAFRETFPAMRPELVSRIEGGSDTTLAKVLKAMLRNNGNIGIRCGIASHRFAELVFSPDGLPPVFLH